MLAEGNYKVKIIGSFTGESGEKKTPFIGLELETHTGEMIDWIGYLSEKEFTKQNGKKSNMLKENLTTLRDAGFRGSKPSDLSNTNLSIDEIFEHNPNLTITVAHEEYTNGQGEIKTKAVVKYINAGGGIEKFDHAQAVKSFDSKFTGVMKQIMGDLKPMKKEVKETEAETVNDDDLPF